MATAAAQPVSGGEASTAGAEEGSVAAGAKKPLYCLYGSNTGSCESFAQRIASEAPSKGMGYELSFSLSFFLVEEWW